jgi:hypothetical protein
MFPSPWLGASFQSGRDGFLDAFLGDGTLGLGQEPSYWSEDLYAEGAGFFPLNHYDCLNDFFGLGTALDTSNTG